MELVAETIADGQLRRCSPLVLSEKVEVFRLAVIILLDDIIEGIVWDADEEVREIDTRVLAYSVPGVGLAERPIVVRTIKAEWRDRRERANVCAELEHMVARHPRDGVGIDVGLRLAE